MFEYMQYNVLPWPSGLSLYFTLVGMAAMAFVLAAAPNVFGGGSAVMVPSQKVGSILVLVLLAICGILLIEDLSQPGRFLNPLIYFHASSALAWGTLLVLGFSACAALFAFGSLTGNSGLLKPVGLIGSLLALSLPLYTGWDLMGNQSRELWASASVPVMFVALSLSSGAGLMAVVSMATGGMNDETGAFLRKVLLVSVASTVVIFFAEVLRMKTGSGDVQAAYAIIGSEMSTKFWVISFVVGMLVPLVLLVVPALSASPAMVTVAGVLATIGAWAYRDVFVAAGQLPMLTF